MIQTYYKSMYEKLLGTQTMTKIKLKRPGYLHQTLQQIQQPSPRNFGPTSSYTTIFYSNSST